MVDVVNLRHARKRKARLQAEAQAAENRALFGRTKQEKEAGAASRRIADKRLDGHLRGRGGDGET